MDENEETTSPARRTRSRKAAKAPVVKSPKAKPTTRRTRKKVVLMEVEVSDEDEETIQDADIPENDKQQNLKQDNSEDTENDQVLKKEYFDEKVGVNGSESNCELVIPDSTEDSVKLVLNDVEMLESLDDTSSRDQDNENDSNIMSGMDESTDKIDFTPEEETQAEHTEAEEDEKKLGVVETEETETTTEENIIESKKIASEMKLEVDEVLEDETEAKCSIEELSQEHNGYETEKKIKEAKEEPIPEADEEAIDDVGRKTAAEVEKTNAELVDKPLEAPVVEIKTESKLKLKVDEDAEKMDCSDEADIKDKPADTEAENISEDELPVVQAVKVPEAEEVSDEELPGPKRAELPADTEVVSEDELPTVKTESKKEGTKRKLDATDYDPGSPTSENEAPTKKPTLESTADKEKDEKPKPKKLPELDKYWKAVNDDPTDFTGWTYLLQYVDQENDMEAAREAYDAFLSHYPYCYGYWRKYADYEKRKGNKKKCEEVFERGLKAIPLSVDLWIHYLTYVKTTRSEDEDFIRSQFERALTACGLEFRSDRLWESFIKWETEGKKLRKVTAIYDKLLATPTQSYTSHFDSFQEHIANNPPNKVVEVDEFLALRKEIRHMLKHDVTTTDSSADINSDAPPGDDDQTKVVSSDEETKSIRERIVSIRRKTHKATVNAVTSRWNYEEGIKRPYFHVKPLERCQLKNWQDYLDYEIEQGDRVRIIVLFERCLIACALYEEFWLKFVHYLESLKDPELHSKIRDVYERACTIHHLKKPILHLQWAMFEESVDNSTRAAEILVNLEKSVPNILQIAYRRINLERRRSDHEKCIQLYEHYILNSKNKIISSNIAIKYSRFCFRIMKDFEKAQEVLKGAISKDPNNPRLYLQLIDLTLQKENVKDSEVIEIIDSFLEKETTDIDQKVLFAQRKLEYVEDFGCDVQSVQMAYEQYQKWLKQSKDNNTKKKEPKTEAASSSSKKEKSGTASSSTATAYSSYGAYGSSSAQPSYPYSGSQQGQNYYPQYGQGDQQYQYQNWQYPQGGYGGYNQWGGYSGGYGGY